MTQHTNDFRKKFVILHLRDGRTIASLAAEYGVSKATVSNWVKAYREECQPNDEAKSEICDEIKSIQCEPIRIDE